MSKSAIAVPAKPHFFGLKETILKFGTEEIALDGTRITARPDDIGV